MEVYTLTHFGKQRLTLQEPPFKTGGEGLIYNIVSNNNKVVKIYKSQAEAAKREEKLKAMIKIAHSASFKESLLCDEIAWPLSPIFDFKDNFIGYIMKKIKSEFSLTTLYQYPPRQNSEITFKQRVDILINLCNLIDRLHKQGQVFGDFNPENIRVSREGKVSFMDADSFAIDTGFKQFKCKVCLPGYVAPEIIRICKLKGNYESLDFFESFSRQSDYYSLAIHIFHMLFRSDPFANRSIATTSLKTLGSDTDIVEKGLSPFFVNLPGRGIPIQAIPTNCFPKYLTDMLKKALLTTNPAERPTAHDWSITLTRYKNELSECHNESTHYYWKSNHQCPYCMADKNYLHLNKYLTTGELPPKSPAPPVHSTPVHSTVVPSQPPTPTVNKTSNKTSKSKSKKKKKNPFKPKHYKYTAFDNKLYWFITMLIGIGIQAGASVFLYSYICGSFFDSSTEPSALAINIALCFCGIIGNIVYNIYLVKPPKNNRHNWYDYFLSALMNIVSTIVLPLLLAILFIILFFTIVIALIPIILYLILAILDCLG